ncbi:GNAT family N-acetyltransferase [Caulobacter sp. S45]|uniref:GNAT family N-acetyltransferase n=1 Tax=Caulobacter sp. S45 TaxID=1641861 RepID=UPI00131C9359|nr:GNAT family N-acetyltransferase [Caulobacter sp. S45]
MLTLATDADLPEAVKLINASYRGETSRQGWANEADYIDGERTTLEALRADLKANPAAKLYLMRNSADGGLLGCVWLEPHDREVWYLGLLTVRPDLQDRQLGRTMLAEAEAVVRREGGRTVRMTVVHLRDTLIAWYQRRGYILTGETSPFAPVDPPRDDLHFIVLQKPLSA